MQETSACEGNIGGGKAVGVHSRANAVIQEDTTAMRRISQRDGSQRFGIQIITKQEELMEAHGKG